MDPRLAAAAALRETWQVPATARGKRLIGYIRVSKAREGMIAPELQQTSILGAIRSEGATLVHLRDPATGLVGPWIMDLDETGREFDNRKVAWMIKQIKDGHADGIAVWQFSRWGRTTRLSLEHYRDLVAAGGMLLSATEPLGNVETPLGQFNLTQALSMAQLMSDQIQASWKAVHQRRLLLGQPHNTKPRFGYIFDPNATAFLDLSQPGQKPAVGFHVPNPEIAPLLRRGYEMRAEGAGGYAVFKLWTKHGLRSVNDCGFTLSTVDHVLDSGFGAGWLSRDVKNGRPATYYPGAHEAVVDQDVWRLYMKRRDLPGHRQTDRAVSDRLTRRARPTSKLSNLPTCSSCLKLMTRNTDKGVRRWACRGVQGVVANPCEHQSSRAEHLVIEDVLKWIITREAEAENLAIAESSTENYSAAVTEADRIAALIAECDTGEARLTKMLRSYSRQKAEAEADPNQGLDRADIAANIAEASAERETFRNRRAELRHNATLVEGSAMPAPDIFRAARRALRDPGLDVADVNFALRKLVRRIWIYPFVRGSDAPRVEVEGGWEPDRLASAA